MKLIDCKAIAEMTGLHPAHIRDRLSKRPDFPRAYVIGSVRRWDEEEVLEWLQKCRQAPDGRRRRRQAA